MKYTTSNPIKANKIVLFLHILICTIFDPEIFRLVIKNAKTSITMTTVENIDPPLDIIYNRQKKILVKQKK